MESVFVLMSRSRSFLASFVAAREAGWCVSAQNERSRKQLTPVLVRRTGTRTHGDGCAHLLVDGVDHSRRVKAARAAMRRAPMKEARRARRNHKALQAADAHGAGNGDSRCGIGRRRRWRKRIIQSRPPATGAVSPTPAAASQRARRNGATLRRTGRRNKPLARTVWAQFEAVFDADASSGPVSTSSKQRHPKAGGRAWKVNPDPTRTLLSEIWL